jgi:hypothetical protein
VRVEAVVSVDPRWSPSPDYYLRWQAMEEKREMKM